MNGKFMSSGGWGWCLDNLIYLNYWVAGGRWVDRKPTVEEASLREEDKAEKSGDQRTETEKETEG